MFITKVVESKTFYFDIRFNTAYFQVPEPHLKMRYNDLKRIHTRTDQIHTSHNASVSFSTMHHSDQKCVLFCSDWCAVGNGTGMWDEWIWSIVILVMNARRHSRSSVTYKYTQFSSALIWFWFAAWNIVMLVSSDNHVTNSGLNSDLYCLGGRDACNNRCHWEEGGVEVRYCVLAIPMQILDNLTIYFQQS